MRRKIFWWAAVAAALAALAVWRFASIDAPVRALDGKTSYLEVTAAGYAKPSLYGWQVDIRLGGVAGILYLQDETEVKPGDIIFGDMRVTRQYRSGDFFKAAASGSVTVEPRGTPFWLLPAVWARAIQTRIALLFPGDGGALLTGILTGDRAGFSPALTEGLFSAGMTHVAAVSGLHISMLAGFVTLVAGSRRRALVAALPLVLVYTAVAGFSPSAVRAAIMCALYLAAPLLGREYSSLRALAAAFLVLLVINPYSIFDPGLQLSFTATLGLALFADKWRSALLRRWGTGSALARWAASALAASFAALVFSTPVAAWWFGGVSALSPVANFLLLPLVNLIFIGGALALALSAAWLPLGALLAAPVGWALSLFMGALGVAAKIPFAVVYTSQPFLVAWLAYLYGLLVVMLFARKWKAPAVLAALSLALCVGLTVWRDSRWGLEAAVLDVGQGLCVVLRSGGQTAVIDCGGAGQAGRAASRYLQSKGVTSVDKLLLTHYDSDHVSGVEALAAAVPILGVYGPDLPGAPDGLAVERVTGVASFYLGEARVTLVPTDWAGDGNERCMAVVVTIDGFSLVVTGDLGAPGERWLLRTGTLPTGGVIVAGHHGSAYSTSDEWLDALLPRAAVISSGTNIYGHPAPSTLARLFGRDIAVYRTDRSGNVVIRVGS